MLTVKLYVKGADDRWIYNGEFAGCTVEKAERFVERYMIKPHRAVIILGGYLG